MADKRNLKRRHFSYYMQAVDNITQEMVGYMADISPNGFRLDCKRPIQPNQEYELRFDLTSEVADKPFVTLLARSKWCRLDEFDPFVYNVGFQLIRVELEDIEIFRRILQKYGTTH
jgi:hypothetical protein